MKSIPNQNNRSNKAKALRRFLRDYLKVIDEQTAREIKIEPATINFEPIPSDEDVAAFYYALREGPARAFYLLLASSGLRRCEVVSLRWEDMDLERGIIRPKYHSNDETKRIYYSFCNQEALQALEGMGISEHDEPIFTFKSREWYQRAFDNAEKAIGFRINPQDLRRWHADKLERLGMPEKYIEFLKLANFMARQGKQNPSYHDLQLHI